jgi:hypothetical protein
MEFTNGDWLGPVTWLLFTNTLPVYNNTRIHRIRISLIGCLWTAAAHARRNNFIFDFGLGGKQATNGL